VPFFNLNLERKSIMTDSITNTHTSLNAQTSNDLASRQQGAAYARLVAVASPAPCGSVQFETAATAITTPPACILRLPEVMARVGLKRASIYLHVAAGTFPKQIALGIRAVGWLESEIDAWLTVRVQQRHIPKP
jgi:prophage regulatory protein